MEIETMQIVRRQFSPELLRQARKDAGQSRTDLAFAMRVTYETVQNWEIGRTSPHVTRLTELADHLRCDVFDFFEVADD